MTTYAPAILIPFTTEPVMTQYLGIEVMGLKRGMVYMGLWSFEEKKGMVINKFGSPVKMEEGGYISPSRRLIDKL
jgi:hypothetical protein